MGFHAYLFSTSSVLMRFPAVAAPPAPRVIFGSEAGVSQQVQVSACAAVGADHVAQYVRQAGVAESTVGAELAHLQLLVCKSLRVWSSTSRQGGGFIWRVAQRHEKRKGFRHQA